MVAGWVFAATGLFALALVPAMLLEGTEPAAAIFGGTVGASMIALGTLLFRRFGKRSWPATFAWVAVPVGIVLVGIGLYTMVFTGASAAAPATLVGGLALVIGGAVTAARLTRV